MKMNLRQTIIAISAIVLLSSCAGYHARQGNRLYSLLAYNQAITEYEKALGKKSFPNEQVKLAESYYLTNNMDKALEAYGKAAGTNAMTTDSKLHYAQVLMQKSKYDDAKTWFEKYLADKPNDEAAKQLMASCAQTAMFVDEVNKYDLQKLALNTGENNFSPTLYKEGFVFVSDRSAKSSARTNYSWTGKPFLNLFYVKQEKTGSFGTPESLTGDINGIYHEGPVTFTADGNTIFFTRNNYIKRNPEKSNDDEVNLKIYSASLKDGKWTDIKEFAYNSDDYSCGHPVLTKDGNTMYFVSDMPGTMGGTDIWMTSKVNNEWSKPVNAGANINTSMNEMFPSLWNDSILYFASKGHMNMGGLDLFSSQNKNGAWSKAENMKSPINSSYDDFGFAMNADGFSGYLTSNRANSLEDNIYSFTRTNLIFTLSGIVVDKVTQLPIAGVMIELLDKETGKKESVTTEADGKFTFKLKANSDYEVVGTKESYFTNTEKVTTKGKTASEDMFVKLRMEMEQIIVDKPIVLENIYYDLDKWNIRADAAIELDKLVIIMKDNPTIKIELSSHTDSRANDDYNMVLSQKRAESAVEYLVAHGVARSRMTAKGYGETKLVNKCSNDVPCSEPEHQQNRRTEFKVTEIRKSAS